MTVFTPNNRPKSVRNCYVIELFGLFFVMSLCLFDISVGIEAFVLGLSQISSFFSCYKWNPIETVLYILTEVYSLDTVNILSWVIMVHIVNEIRFIIV